MTPEVPNAANFHMAAKPEQQRRANANEVISDFTLIQLLTFAIYGKSTKSALRN